MKNPKLILKFVLFLVISIFISNAGKDVVRSEENTLKALLENFKQYKTTNAHFHAGNLYEHSLWVAITVNEWFSAKNEWTEGLAEHDKKISLVAALLHDVGKAGDLDFVYYTKPNHPQVGQAYILGKEKFKIDGTKSFNFDALFKAMHISDNEKRLISILVRAHHDLGEVLKKVSGPKKKTLPDDILHPHLDAYMHKLKAYAGYAGYTGPIDRRIVRLAMLISAADVKGASPCDCMHEFSLDNLAVSSSPKRVHSQATDKFHEFEYHTRGKHIRNEALRCL